MRARKVRYEHSSLDDACLISVIDQHTVQWLCSWHTRYSLLHCCTHSHALIHPADLATATLEEQQVRGFAVEIAVHC